MCTLRGLGLSLVAACALLADAVTPASAGYYVCSVSGGGKQFQDQPCRTLVTPAARTSGETRRGADTRHASNARPPAGIAPSWFEQPAEVPYSAYCDERGCECGSLERAFEAGLSLAVADALYLDGSWHRYDQSLHELRNADAPNESFAARMALEDAGCDVLMSQRTLALFAEAEFSNLRRRAQSAEDLGRDTPEACDGFSDIACEDHSAYMLYQRMTVDLKALAGERVRERFDTAEH